MSISLICAVVLRIAVAMVCLFSLVALLVRFKQNSSDWNVKTKDYWYALLMWSLSGLVLAIQGLLESRLITPAIVFATAAALVTGKGLHRKGSWGSDR